jgi:hypothetical protein
MAAPSRREAETQTQRLKFFAKQMGYRLLWEASGNHPTDFDAAMALPPNHLSRGCYRIRLVEYRQKAVESHRGEMHAGYRMQKLGWHTPCLRTGIMIESHKLADRQPFIFVVDILREDGANDMRYAEVSLARLLELQESESQQQERFNDYTSAGNRKRSSIKFISLKWFHPVP